jgi:hypothetical protein
MRQTAGALPPDVVADTPHLLLRRHCRERKVRRTRARRQSHAASAGSASISRRPLLVIDGDSFAHRSYHALPKTIHQSDGKGAGAILGFANFLLRFYADEKPRAIIVGWDSLEAPTRRHEMFPAYQPGREFNDDLIEQLNVLPEFAAACGFANTKGPGFEADDFLAAASLPKNAEAVPQWWRAAIGIRFNLPRQAQQSSTRFGAAKSRTSGPMRSGNGMALTRSRCGTSSRFAAIHPTNFPAR